MKTIKLGLFILTVFILAPLNIRAQVKEIPITTSSREALEFYLSGRNKQDVADFDAALILFEKAIQKDPNFAMAYLSRAYCGGGYNVFRQNLDKAVSLISKVSEGEKLMLLYEQASADGNGQKQKEYHDALLKSFPSDKRVQANAGWYYYSFGDYPKAVIYFNKAAELDNKYAPAFNTLGICQSFLNNYTEAEKAFQTYIKLAPGNADPYDSYAFLLLKMGKDEEAIVQYKKALEKNPAFSSSLAGLGNVYIFKGDFESARKYYKDCFDKATNIDWKFGGLFNKAVSYLYEGKPGNTMTTFDELATLAQKEKLVPYEVWSYSFKGFTYTELGQLQEGLKCYEKAIDLVNKSALPDADKENMVTSSMLWRIYFLSANNQLDKATAESDKCKLKIESRKNPGEEKSFNSFIGYLELKKGNYDKAVQFLNKGDIEDPWVWYYTAVAYNKKGDKQNASKQLEKVRKCHLNSLGLALVRKRAMEELKK
ncbi:MAG: tetratricopeptide repeat protein [Mariniphaga sp.]